MLFRRENVFFNRSRIGMTSTLTDAVRVVAGKEGDVTKFKIDRWQERQLMIMFIVLTKGTLRGDGSWVGENQ